MKNNPFNLQDSVVLVSGASRGIGLAIADGFASQGARVVISGRVETSLIEACARPAQTKQNMSYRVCDIAEQSQITETINSIVEEYKQIDTLVNCAGVNQRMPVEQYTAEQFDSILEINLRGAFLMSQAVGKVMIEQGSGNQINIDSYTSFSPLSHVTPYAMSKAGMTAMTRGLALEWGKHGVRVNGIAPGFIVTDLNKQLWENQNMQNWSQVTTPVQRLGAPEDLAGTAMFLASPAAAFISGQTIRVDGGLSAGTNWPIDNDFSVTPS